MFWLLIVDWVVGYANRFILIRLSLDLREVEDPLMGVVKHVELHYMEGVRHGKVAHDVRHTSKHVQSLVNTG
jgi:hypothetical protein